MNEAFEKYWADQLKSCGATCERERILPPYQEVFEAGAAALLGEVKRVENERVKHEP